MDPLIYRIIHLVGVMALFAALGAAATGGDKGSKKLAGMLHGIALLLILVSGFGLVAKLATGFAWWIIVKIFIWILMGASLSLASRKVIPAGATIGILLALGTVAAILGVYKGAF